MKEKKYVELKKSPVKKMNSIISSIQSELIRECTHRIGKLESRFPVLTKKLADPTQHASLGEEMDEAIDFAFKQNSISYLPLYTGIKKKQQNNNKTHEESGQQAQQSHLPQVTVETLLWNMRAWDVNNDDLPCLSIDEKNSNCAFADLCASVDHPLLSEDRSGTLCGTSFKFDGENADAQFQSNKIPRRYCAFCYLLQTSIEIHSLEAYRATCEHAATRINTFSVIASPEVGGGEASMFLPSHPLIHGKYPIFDTNVMPGYMRRSEGYRKIHLLTSPDANEDIQELLGSKDVVLSLTPPWKICLNKGEDSRDINLGTVMMPSYIMTDRVTAAATTKSIPKKTSQHPRAIAKNSLPPDHVIAITTGSREDIRNNTNLPGKVHEMHYNFVGNEDSDGS